MLVDVRPCRAASRPPRAGEPPRTGRSRRPPTRSGSPRGPASGCDASSRTAPAPAAAARRPRPRGRGPSAAVRSISIVALGGIAGESDGPHARRLQFVDRAGDVHDVGHPDVRDGAGRRLRRRAVQRRRVARLANHPVHPGRVRRRGGSRRRCADPRRRPARRSAAAPAPRPPGPRRSSRSAARPRRPRPGAAARGPRDRARPPPPVARRTLARAAISRTACMR